MRNLLFFSGLMLFSMAIFLSCSKEADISEPQGRAIPTITFGPQDSSWMLRLINEDSVANRWRVTNEVWWITCEPTSGRIAAGGTDSFMIYVDRSGYTPGEYSDSFYITLGSRTRQVNVIMQVE
ncbi:MAG: hypothetical protein K6F94_07590 [Bacteroidaceae bacterium]|nr:hypothetical protein [Bacteroidaceae bacterium]